MSSINIQYYKSPVGELIIGSFSEQLVLCDWRYRKMRSAIDKRIKGQLLAEYIKNSDDIIQECIQQFEEYFKGSRKEFQLPLKLVGTEFQQKVWQELLEVPYGKTETYLGLSRKLGNEKAIRAVATANGANAISIIVPCHRIIGSNNELVGYAGGLSTKKRLLKLEGAALFSQQMELF